ncbi:MAG: hypothetical protein U9R75_11705 [Candidatus Thermoplasmatota archaeon]|nr:hypothetical protein [Candidatus Thermoplasmatota archaeon]
MKYSGMSSRERYLLEEISLRSIKIITPLITSGILGETIENTYRILNRMVKKDLMIRLEKGKYIPISDQEEMDIYEVASHIIVPSYISFWSGMHIYGYTTQVPTTVYVMTTVQKSPLNMMDCTVRFVKSSHFFGYEKIGEMVIAEKEKLFLDCLEFPHYSGGINEIMSAMKKADIDMDLMIDYARRMNVRSLNSRLGYLIEALEIDGQIDELEERISRVYIPLDPSSNKNGKKNKRWMILDDLG